MKKMSKRVRQLFIVAPLFAVVILFVVFFSVLDWYQNSMREAIKEAHRNMHILQAYEKLSKKNQTAFSDIELKIYKDFNVGDLHKLVDGKGVYLYRLQDGVFVDICSHEKLENAQNLALLNKHIKDLLEKKEYFVQNVVDKNSVEQKLFRYYPHSAIVVLSTLTQSSYELAYKNYIDSISSKLNRTRTIVLFIMFLASILVAIILSFAIKRAGVDFDDAQEDMRKLNESLKMVNSHLEKQLMQDSQTGLPNTRMLESDIKDLSEPKVIIVDIDDLKKIREFCDSKTTEDAVLFVKRVLSRFCQKHNEYSMKLYYVGIGQFVLLEDAPIDFERYEMLAKKLSKRLRGARVKSNSNYNFVEFTCTISFSLEQKNTIETATIALMRAREKNKDFLCYFKNINENEVYQNKMKSADFIKIAIERDKIVPYYQPIFDVDGNITKYECLVRIMNDEKKPVSPWEFLEVSKDLKRYSQIEKILIKKSLDSIKGTKKNISINVALKDITDGEVSVFLVEQITKNNVANQVILELLENEYVEHSGRVEAFIGRIKSMGVRIAIDDFGSGYSNFSYMLSLQPDFVKVDGSLIKNIHKDDKSRAIVSAILHFTKKLNIPAVAEFVHSKEVFEICKELGFDEFQGFYLGEPKDNMI